MKEMKDSVYGGLAVLKYPGLFHKYEILDKSLDHLSHHDLVIFYKSSDHNVDELQEFIE